MNFISHLLGHEGEAGMRDIKTSILDSLCAETHFVAATGEGSLFALLKKVGWASSLAAGESSLSLSSTSFFYCKVELTDEGQLHASEVGELVFK